MKGMGFHLDDGVLEKAVFTEGLLVVTVAKDGQRFELGLKPVSWAKALGTV